MLNKTGDLPVFSVHWIFKYREECIDLMIASLLAVPDILDSMCGYTVTAWGSCIHLSTVHTRTSADQRALSRLPLALILPFLNKKWQQQHCCTYIKWIYRITKSLVPFSFEEKLQKESGCRDWSATAKVQDNCIQSCLELVYSKHIAIG